MRLNLQGAEHYASTTLVSRCLTGDAFAWEEFVTLYKGLIYHHCYAGTNCSADAEELSQDVFLKLFRNLHTFQAQKGNLANWIRSITCNHVADHFRRTKLIRSTDSFHDDGQPGMEERLIDPAPPQDQLVARSELKRRIHAALKSLSGANRDVIILRDIRDLDGKETAQLLGIPEGTVKSRLSRGRKELALRLSPQALLFSSGPSL